MCGSEVYRYEWRCFGYPYPSVCRTQALAGDQGKTTHFGGKRSGEPKASSLDPNPHGKGSVALNEQVGESAEQQSTAQSTVGQTAQLTSDPNRGQRLIWPPRTGACAVVPAEIMGGEVICPVGPHSFASGVRVCADDVRSSKHSAAATQIVSASSENMPSPRTTKLLAVLFISAEAGDVFVDVGTWNL